MLGIWRVRVRRMVERRARTRRARARRMRRVEGKWNEVRVRESEGKRE